MKTQVVSITNFQNQFDELKIVVLLGEITQQFRFIVKKSKIKDRILLTFIEDANFAEIFRFNDHLAIAITNLVKKVYQGENIDFPINLGDYGTALEALAQQKTFENVYEGEYVYFENDSFEHQQFSSEVISDSQKNHESVKLEGIGEKMRRRLRTTEPAPTHKPRTPQKHPSEIDV